MNKDVGEEIEEDSPMKFDDDMREIDKKYVREFGSEDEDQEVEDATIKFQSSASG